MEKGQVSDLCPLLIKTSTSSSAQWFRKADLGTHETQGSRERKGNIPRRGPINRGTDQHMNLKRTRQRLQG